MSQDAKNQTTQEGIEEFSIYALFILACGVEGVQESEESVAVDAKLGRIDQRLQKIERLLESQGK